MVEKKPSWFLVRRVYKVGGCLLCLFYLHPTFYQYVASLF